MMTASARSDVRPRVVKDCVAGAKAPAQRAEHLTMEAAAQFLRVVYRLQLSGSQRFPPDLL